MSDKNLYQGWLVLERTLGQGLMIGDAVVIFKSAKQKGRIRLAIKAPKEMHIQRLEISEIPIKQKTSIDHK